MTSGICFGALECFQGTHVGCDWVARLEDTGGIKKENLEPHTVVKSRRWSLGRMSLRWEWWEFLKGEHRSCESHLTPSLIQTFIHSTDIYWVPGRVLGDNVVNRSDLVSSFMRFISQQSGQIGQANKNMVISTRHKYSEENGDRHAIPSQSNEEKLHREAAQKHLRILDAPSSFQSCKILEKSHSHWSLYLSGI